jgi:hypothetical protein
LAFAIGIFSTKDYFTYLILSYKIWGVSYSVPFEMIVEDATSLMAESVNRERILRLWGCVGLLTIGFALMVF